MAYPADGGNAQVRGRTRAADLGFLDGLEPAEPGSGMPYRRRPEAGGGKPDGTGAQGDAAVGSGAVGSGAGVALKR